MRRARWLPIVLFATTAGVIAACSSAGELDPGIGGSGGGFSANGGAGAGSNGTAGGGNGTDVSEDTSKTESVGAGTGGGGGGPTTGTTTTTTTSPGAGGGGGEGAGTADCGDTGEPKVFYMSSDDSSSMGSPALAREFLTAGLAPPPALIRPYEFLNYYRIRYDLPTDGLLDVAVSYAPVPDDASLYRFQVGVQAFAVTRPPMALTFVVDASSSLIGEGIVRERKAIEAIASKLQDGDLVSFVTWASEDAVVLDSHEVKGPNDPALLAAAKDLVPGGGSDLHSGLQHGYELAKGTHSDKVLSRVVLISDGGANLGVVDRDLIAAEAKNGDDLGIYLIGIGVGPAQGYSDTLMNTVTDAGRGSYVYLDSEAEATAVLADRFDEVMDVAARAVEVKLTLPSYFSIKTTSAEDVSTVKTEVQPQHLAPGDSMVFFQILSHDSAQPVCANDDIQVQVTWEAPALHPATLSGGKTFDTWSMPIGLLEGVTPQMLKGEAVVAYARALSTQRKVDFTKAQAAVDAAQADAALTEDGELTSIEGLLAKFPESEKKD